MACNKDPRAPHGFDRTASHTQDRYVCECEGWVAPDDVWTTDVDKLRADLAAAQRELVILKQVVSDYRFVTQPYLLGCIQASDWIEGEVKRRLAANA